MDPVQASVEEASIRCVSGAVSRAEEYAVGEEVAHTRRIGREGAMHHVDPVPHCLHTKILLFRYASAVAYRLSSRWKARQSTC